jgi:DNA-binding GntR family transcriptional regulator
MKKKTSRKRDVLRAAEVVLEMIAAGERITSRAVAQRASVSPQWARKVLHELERRGWIISEYNGDGAHPNKIVWRRRDVEVQRAPHRD